MTEPKTSTKIPPVLMVLWALPVLAGLGVVALAFALNWEPWFGYASVIAGGLLSLMLVGNHFKVGPGA